MALAYIGTWGVSGAAMGTGIRVKGRVKCGDLAFVGRRVWAFAMDH